MVSIIEITEDKVQELSENMEKVLRYGGKVMDCISHLSDNSRMGERMPQYRDYRDYPRHEERRQREDINSDWNYPSRYAERDGGGYHGGGGYR